MPSGAMPTSYPIRRCSPPDFRDNAAGGCGDGGYLAYIGRICPEKRPDWAIEIARAPGCR